MAHHLWTSPITGYRRTGTRLSELRSLFDSGITVHSILEPPQSCREDEGAVDMAQILGERDFDVAGVKSHENGPVIGFVERKELVSGLVSDHVKPLSAQVLISDATPIPSVLTALKELQQRAEPSTGAALSDPENGIAEVRGMIWRGRREALLSLLVQRGILGLEAYVPIVVEMDAMETGRFEEAQVVRHLRSQGGDTVRRIYHTIPSAVDELKSLLEYDAPTYNLIHDFYKSIRNPLFHGCEFSTSTENVLEVFRLFRRVYSWADSDFPLTGIDVPLGE